MHKQLKRRKGLLGLVVPEVSVHGWQAPLLWACGEADVMAGRARWGTAPALVAVGRRDEGARVPTSPSRTRPVGAFPLYPGLPPEGLLPSCGTVSQGPDLQHMSS